MRGEVDDRARVVGGVGVLGLERGGQRLRGAEVGALEPLVEAGGAKRGAHLVGDGDEQAHVVLVERVRAHLLHVDRTPQLAVDPQRRRRAPSGRRASRASPRSPESRLASPTSIGRCSRRQRPITPCWRRCDQPLSPSASNAAPRTAAASTRSSSRIRMTAHRK